MASAMICMHNMHQLTFGHDTPTWKAGENIIMKLLELLVEVWTNGSPGRFYGLTRLVPPTLAVRICNGERAIKERMSEEPS